jgi:hypothetical protein
MSPLELVDRMRLKFPKVGPVANKKSQEEVEVLSYGGREIRSGYDLTNEEIDELLSAADAPKTPIRRCAQERRHLAELIAEQQVKGWSFIAARRFREAHGLTISQMKHLEADASKILRNAYEGVNREDLVARQLHRLEHIAEKAAEVNAHSTAMACVTTILKTVGADKPEE